MQNREEFLEAIKKVRSEYIESQRTGTDRPFIKIIVKYDEMYDYILNGGLLPARPQILPGIPNEYQYFLTLTEDQRKKYFEEIELLKRSL